MKKFTFLFAFILLSIATIQAQRNAPDFTVTDIDGNTHNLYQILDEDKLVIVDWSATWCSFCWGFHQQKFLQDINEIYGPAGTDQVVVIFYEADANTDLNALKGVSGNTRGDWVTGTDFPIINESPLSLKSQDYGYSSFPTVSLIRSDRMIVSDLYELRNQGLDAMIAEIEEALKFVAIPNVETFDVEVFPNPAKDVLYIAGLKGEVAQMQFINMKGQALPARHIQNLSQQDIEVPIAHLDSGTYMLLITDTEGARIQTQFVKN